jgi:hypothetical protein
VIGEFDTDECFVLVSGSSACPVRKATATHAGERLSVEMTVRQRMSATIETPVEDESCAYCGSLIFEHDPICVRDCTDGCGSPTYFCNYACLSTHIEANELTAGDACEWSPE